MSAIQHSWIAWSFAKKQITVFIVFYFGMTLCFFIYGSCLTKLQTFIGHTSLTLINVGKKEE
jgi:hypothetical protein